MHAFVTRHRVIVVVLLLASVLAYLGLYATRRARDAGPAAMPASSDGPRPNRSP